MDKQRSASRLTVAVLDDEAIVRRSLVRFLNVVGIQARAYESPLEFLEGCLHESPDCAVIDLQMPVLPGIEVLEQLKARKLGFPVVVLSATDDGNVRQRCESLGARYFLLKPVEGHKLLTAIDSALGHWSRESTATERETPDSR